MEEIEDMIIAMVAIVIAVAVAFYGIEVFFTKDFLVVAAVLFFTIGIGFISHELGHKYMAERYGSAARFVMWPTGILLMLVLALSPLRLIFAAPGAVYIFKRFMSNKENGIISLAGPVVNIILYFFFAAILVSSNVFNFELAKIVKDISVIGLQINALLAMFNLLPIFILDGAKVFRWNVGVWAGAFVLSLWMMFNWPVFLG